MAPQWHESIEPGYHCTMLWTYELMSQLAGRTIWTDRFQVVRPAGCPAARTSRERQISNGPTRRTSSGSDHVCWDPPNRMCLRSYGRAEAFWPTRFQTVRPAGRPAGRTLWNSRFQTVRPAGRPAGPPLEAGGRLLGVWGAEPPVFGQSPPEYSIELAGLVRRD